MKKLVLRGKILFLNGPNLNRLGRRDRAQYGITTLPQIVTSAKKIVQMHGFSLRAMQSNHSGYLIDWIQAFVDEGPEGLMKGIVINPGGLTHYDIALRDALGDAKTQGVSAIEVHLSDTDEREEFRHISFVRKVCIGHVKGLGADGYRIGLLELMAHLERMRRNGSSKL